MKFKAKKILALLLSMLVLLSAVSINAFALEYGSEWSGYYQVAPTSFTDVSADHWAYNAIMQVYQKNWFAGYPDGSFRPNARITRAEALKVFVVFLGLDYESVDLSNITYTDTASHWAAAYIEAGKDLFPAHTTIQGKTPFNPNMPVTREDTIYALAKALGCDVDVKYPDLSNLNMFKDQNSISGNVKSVFSIALAHGLVAGFPDSTIRAQAALTRAEFATLLLRGTEHGFHDKYTAKIASVQVSPASPVELEIGASVTLTARATYTDGTNQPYTALSPYDASSNGVVSLSGTTITGLKEGTAEIKYNDSYLKNDTLTVIVKKPSDAPKIKVTEYPETTELADVSIGGYVEDKDVASVDLTANGKDVKLDSKGGFTTSVSLKVGANEIKFVATNKYGATAEKTITITRTDVPELLITDYKQRTTARSTPVSGVIKYHDLSAIRLECNGKNVAFSADGTFTTTVDLKIGKNPFTFVATTNGGNKAEQAIVIRRYEEIIEEEPPKVLPEVVLHTWDWMAAIPVTTQYKSVEVVMVIDDSGSLGGDYGVLANGFFNGGTDPQHKRLEVARNFVDAANDNAKIGIVKFDSGVQKVTSGMVTCNAAGKAELKSKLTINNGVFDSRGTTYMYEGINEGFDLFETTDPSVMKVMIVFSDGQAHDTQLHAQTVLNASNQDITIYTVGLGSSTSYFESYMKPLATNTGGAFYLANNANELKNIFETITIMIDTQTDSDGDGISDYYEDSLKDKNGNPMPTDKNKADTDGDGKTDGEEIRLEFEYRNNQTEVKVTAYMSSNPTMKDSDGDGADDKNDSYPLDANGK